MHKVDKRPWAFRGPFTEPDLQALPLYADRALPSLGPAALHRSYYGDTPIEELAFRFPARARRVIAELKIRTLGELLLMTPSKLQVSSGVGSLTILGVQGEISRYLAQANGLTPALSLDMRSFDSMLSSYLDLTVKKERSRSIMCFRLGHGNRPPVTLTQTADEFGISRERIRQLEIQARREMRSSLYPRLLEPVAEFVRRQLRRCGGIQDLERLGASLSVHMKWSARPSTHGLTALLELFPDLSCPRPGEVALEGFPCISCAQAGKALAKLANQQGQVPVARAFAEVTRCCRSGCRKHLHPPRDFSAPLVASIARTQPWLQVDEGILYSERQWKVHNSTIGALAAEIVKAADRPMHYSEIAKELRRQDGVTITLHNLHGRIHLMKDIALWGVGTFVHRDNLPTDQALFKKVEAWLVQRLSTGIPCISAFGAFQQFRNECQSAGITSEVALYSCLKNSGSTKLVFPRCPHIYAAGKNVKHVPLHLSIRKWLRGNDCLSSRRRMIALLRNELGLKSYQAYQALRRLNTIRTD